MKISFRGAEETDVPHLLTFGARMFGEGEYQSSSAYLDWLYRESPHARGVQDAILALVDGNIVGMVHRMALPCTGPSGPTTLFSLQNHVIAPELRGGAGVMLLRHASRGAITLSPGVHGRLGDVYRKLGYVELPSFWTSRVVAPLRAGRQTALRRIGRRGGRGTRPSISLHKVRRALGSGGAATAAPSEQKLFAIAATMNSQASSLSGGSRVDWTAESIRWRFFSETGPRHVLIERGSDWAIVSLGAREGVTVSRVLEISGDDVGFMRSLSKTARAMGAAVDLSYSTRRSFRDAQLASGWRDRKSPPSTFAYGVGNFSATAAVGDVGFEAFGTKVGR